MQLTANATRADNSVENVSPQAVWMSQDPRVVEMSTTGAAKGIGRGEAVIRTYYGGWSASTRTFVLPEGTYRLDGRVTDSGIGVAGVTVTVMGSVGGDLTTISDEEGRYWLYGVRDRVRLQAKGAGYLDRIEEVDVADHRSFDVEVTAERERTDLRGRYRLTLHRAPCPGTPVPDTRSYDATVTQDGPRLRVALSGADFIVTRGRGNAFSGFIDGGNRVTFAIGDPSDEYHYGPYDFVERIDDARALIVSGSVTAELSSTGISGTLRGAFLRRPASSRSCESMRAMGRRTGSRWFDGSCGHAPLQRRPQRCRPCAISWPSSSCRQQVWADSRGAHCINRQRRSAWSSLPSTPPVPTTSRCMASWTRRCPISIGWRARGWSSIRRHPSRR